MNKRMRIGMREATRLTQAGQLLEATAAIQRTLRGLPVSANNPPADDIIEGTFRVVNPASRSTAGGAQQATMYLPPAQTTAAPSAAPASAGTCGEFLSGVYTNAAGTRPYKLYIPKGYAGQSLPLIVMLHGCTQSPDDFAAGTRMNALADEQFFFVVYPAQSSGANTTKCWNWFKAADQQQGQGEPSLIAGITREVAGSYAIDPQRIYVAGLSSGGAMAAIMAITYPDLYAAVGIHSGLAYGAAHDMQSAFAAMQHGGAGVATPRNGSTAESPAVPMIVFHGDRDTTVSPRNADQLVAQWIELHASKALGISKGSQLKPQVQRVQPAKGRAYSRAVYHDARGAAVIERWLIEGAGHAWAGGSPDGSFTDPAGPDATSEMLRFFNAHPRPQA